MAGSRNRRGGGRSRGRNGRGRRSTDNTPLWAVVAFAVAAVLWRVGVFVEDHPVAAVTVLVALVGVLAAAGWLVVRGRRARSARQDALDRNVAVTDGMTGPQFERYVARLMRRDGFRRVTLSGGAGDLGADVTGYTPDGRRVVVQCKRFTGALGTPHVQKFNGTVWPVHHAQVALLVTTGRATRDARELARRFGIILVERDALAAWATDGVPPVPAAPRRRIRPSPGAPAD